jgi:hypothetical protein
MRTVVLCAAVAPFLWFAWKDNLFHLRGRRVPALENLLHLGLAVALALVFTGAFAAKIKLLFAGLGGVGVLGALDELVYHRAIPSDEHDLHAKEHFTLLVFVAAAFAFAWYAR